MHIDDSPQSVIERSTPMVHKGELYRKERYQNIVNDLVYIYISSVGCLTACQSCSVAFKNKFTL